MEKGSDVCGTRVLGYTRRSYQTISGGEASEGDVSRNSDSFSKAQIRDELTVGELVEVIKRIGPL